MYQAKRINLAVIDATEELTKAQYDKLVISGNIEELSDAECREIIDSVHKAVTTGLPITDIKDVEGLDVIDEYGKKYRKYVKRIPDAVIKSKNKTEFSTKEREALSKTGEAMSDGSFPIRNKQDLKDAIKAVGRAKSYDAAKKHIIKRAKALGLTNELPNDWNK